MTKRKLNIARLILVAVLVAALSSAVCLVAFAEDATATAQTRIFDDTFDRMLDDGRGEGTVPAFRSINWEAGQCDDSEDPIFKIASAKISAGVDTLNITLRSETVKLADLTIAFRINDDTPLKVYPLTSEQVSDGIEEGFEISSEWQTLSIDLAMANIGIAAATPDAFVGFHLYATDNTKAGSLDISKVFVTSGISETVIYNFDNISDIHWCGTEAGTYVDHPAYYPITDSKQLTSTAGNLDEEYSAIVIKAKGSGSVTVAPVLEDGTVGTAKAWTTLTDLEGTAVAAIGESYVNHVISLESLGVTKIKGVQIAVEGGNVDVSQVFLTNMESGVPVTYFPVLDTDSIVYMSQFDFEYLKVGKDYEAASAACAPFNLNYILCYNGAPSVVTNGHLVLDANGQTHTNMKINSKNGSDGRRYLVIKYKLQNGATLNDFRINHLDGTTGDIVTGSLPVYANQMVAGFGLPSLSAVNPYKDGGYDYLIVDCKETFGSTNIAGFDMYFSGAGQMLIDEIYYADAYVPDLDVENKLVFDDYTALPSVDSGYWWTDISDLSKLSIEDGALKVEVPAGTGVCIGGAKPNNNKVGNHRYMVFRMKSENLDMSTFHIIWKTSPAEVVSYFNQGNFVTLDGKEYVLGEEYSEFIIDLDASGIDRAIDEYRLWIGGWNAEAGTLYIDEVYFADELVVGETKYTVSKELATSEAGYNYIAGGGFANTKSAPIVKLSLTAPNTFVYEGFRFEFKLKDGSKVEYGVSHGLQFATPVELGEGETAEDLTQTFVLDLTSIGIAKYADITEIHMHMDKIKVAGTVKLDVNYIDYIPSIVDVTLPTNDDAKPIITHSIAATGTVNKEITLNAVATDNYDATVSVKYEVTMGSTNVTVTDGKFTPTAVGTYSVKITASDAIGNVATETVSIVVAAEQVTDPGTTEPGQPNDGLSTGAIVGIVIGCVAVVAAGVVAFIFIRKKKANK